MAPTPPLTASAERDRGSVMPMTVILIVFLMVGAWALVSASQQWESRREAKAVAAAASRAGAQGDSDGLRAGVITDPVAAQARAMAIIAASGATGTATVDSDGTVAVTVTVDVEYAFPTAGFPASVTASAVSVATPNVVGG